MLAAFTRRARNASAINELVRDATAVTTSTSSSTLAASSAAVCICPLLPLPRSPLCAACNPHAPLSSHARFFSTRTHPATWTPLSASSSANVRSLRNLRLPLHFSRAVPVSPSRTLAAPHAFRTALFSTTAKPDDSASSSSSSSSSGKSDAASSPSSSADAGSEFKDGGEGAGAGARGKDGEGKDKDKSRPKDEDYPEWDESDPSMSSHDAHFAETTTVGKPKNWLRIGMWVVGCGAGFYALMQWGGDLFNKTLEWYFLKELELRGVGSIPQLDSFKAMLVNPNLIGNVEAVRELLVRNPDLLDQLIREGLGIKGVEKGPLGVGSEQLDYDDMARAQWILSLLVTAAATDRYVIQALREAHQRSKKAQAEFIKPENWKKREEERVQREMVEREKKRAEGHAQIDQSGPPSSRAIRKKEFDAALNAAFPISPVRPTPPPTEVPLTLMQLLIRHGLHRLGKDNELQLEEELKKKRKEEILNNKKKQEEELALRMLVSGKDAEAEAAAARKAEAAAASSSARALPATLPTDPSNPESGEAPLVPLTPEQASAMKLDAEVQEWVATKRSMFHKMIEGMVEKSLAPLSWSLLKLMVEPTTANQQHLYGGELVSFNGDGEPLTRLDVEVRSLRQELLSQAFVPLVLYMQPPPSGQVAVMPLWGAEGQGAATDLLGTMLFDIPDLSTVPQRYGETIKSAMFSALAQLAGVYSEQHHPGASVRAFTHLLELDPHNAGVMTQLAVELMKLGQMQQLKKAEKEAEREAISAASKANGVDVESVSVPRVPVADVDPRSNPFFPAALRFLRQALDLDPNSLEANFHYTKLLVITREKDEKKINKAVEGLMEAVRAAPTDIHAGAAPAGVSDWSAPFAEVHPTLSPAYNLLIRALERLHRYDDALDLSREWSWRIHADSIAHFTLGRLMIKYSLDAPGAALEAERSLMTALDLDPSKAETYYQLALLAFKAGAGARDEDAERFVRQALEAKEKVDKKIRENVTRQLMQQQMALNATTAEATRMFAGEEGASTTVTPAAGPAAPASTSGAAPPPFRIANSIPRAHLLLSKIALRANPPRMEDALAEVDRYLADQPTSTDGLMHKAAVLEKMNEQQEAYAALAKLVRVWSRKMQHNNNNNNNKDKKSTSTTTVNNLPTRKAYFAAHPSEAAMFNSIDRVCSKPDQAPQGHAQMESFLKMCEEMKNLKSKCK